MQQLASMLISHHRNKAAPHTTTELFTRPNFQLLIQCPQCLTMSLCLGSILIDYVKVKNELFGHISNDIENML